MQNDVNAMRKCMYLSVIFVIKFENTHAHTLNLYIITHTHDTIPIYMSSYIYLCLVISSYSALDPVQLFHISAASNILAVHVYTTLTRKLWKNSQNTVMRTTLI